MRTPTSPLPLLPLLPSVILRKRANVICIAEDGKKQEEEREG